MSVFIINAIFAIIGLIFGVIYAMLYGKNKSPILLFWTIIFTVMTAINIILLV